MQLEELRNAVVTLAKSNDEHERRISAMESQVDSCRRGTQAAAAAIVEMREREQTLNTRLDGLDEATAALRLDIGTKATTATLEGLLKLKMDRKGSEELAAQISELRAAVDSQITGLGEDVERCAAQMHGVRQQVSAVRHAAGAMVGAPATEADAVDPSGAIRPSCRACGVGSGPTSSGAALRPTSAAPRGHTPSTVPDPSDGSNYRVDRFACAGTAAAAPEGGGAAGSPHEPVAPAGSRRPQSARAPRSPALSPRAAPQRWYDAHRGSGLVVTGQQPRFPPSRVISGGMPGTALPSRASELYALKPRYAEAPPFDEFLHVASAIRPGAPGHNAAGGMSYRVAAELARQGQACLASGDLAPAARLAPSTTEGLGSS